MDGWIDEPHPLRVAGDFLAGRDNLVAVSIGGETVALGGGGLHRDVAIEIDAAVRVGVRDGVGGDVCGQRCWCCDGDCHCGVVWSWSRRWKRRKMEEARMLMVGFF